MGNQLCAAEAPDYFELDADGYARVTQRDLGGSSLTTLRRAEAICPTGAVTVEIDRADG